VRWIAPSGYAHLFIFGVAIPILAVRAMKLIESRPLAARHRYFKAVLIQLVAFAALSILVARLNWIELFPRRIPPPSAIGAGVLFLACAIPFGWTRWRKAVQERKRIVALFMPIDHFERMLWVGSAALAGFGEEITWRGVQTALLTRLTGNLLVAIFIAIVMFALAHAVQGWKSVAVIAIFSAGFHAIVWLSGSLYVAMAVHFLYDLIAGFSYAHLGRKYNYVIPSAAEREGPGRGLPPATDPV
jgi:membrane protease YdiL (CAAX protease family)